MKYARGDIDGGGGKVTYGCSDINSSGSGGDELLSSTDMITWTIGETDKSMR